MVLENRNKGRAYCTILCYSKEGDDSKSFTTVNRVISEVKARHWAIECLAWYPVVVGQDTSEVFVFEILPFASAETEKAHE